MIHQYVCFILRSTATEERGQRREQQQQQQQEQAAWRAAAEEGERGRKVQLCY